MEHRVTPEFKEHLDWVFADNIPVWERNNIQRVISMAACIVDGVLVVGNRHFCPIMQMTIALLNLDISKHAGGKEQGFVDQYGVYLTRQEAWLVAKQSGQIKHVFTEGVLFSECYL